MSRKDAREIAMKLLYQRDITGEYNKNCLEDLRHEFSLSDKDNIYVEDLLRGFAKYQTQIDQYISKFSKGWSIKRMARVDLAILRLAMYEIIYVDDIPASVSINEGVNLAKKYGNEKSGSFVNGILGNFMRTLRDNNEGTAEE